MLDKVIPDPNLRKPIYQGFAAIGILLGATQVAFGVAQSAQPLWLDVAVAVYGFLAGAGFAVAQANTPGDTEFPSE